jgi:hypothetical protein
VGFLVLQVELFVVMIGVKGYGIMLLHFIHQVQMSSKEVKSRRSTVFRNVTLLIGSASVLNIIEFVAMLATSGTSAKSTEVASLLMSFLTIDDRM